MGNQKKIELKYEHFRPEKTSTYDLLININRHNLSYAIINQEEELLEVLFDTEISSSIEACLSELVDQKAELGLPFRKIKICIHSFEYTFIPQVLFAHSSLYGYSKFLKSSSHSDVIVNSIRPARIMNIFSVPKEIHNLMTRFFPSSQIFHQSTVFIEGIRRVMKDSAKTSMFLCLKDGSLQLAVINKTGLLHYNVFYSSSVDDFNYFLLLTIEGLRLNLIETSLTVAGDITLGSDHYSRTRKYFQEVAFADSKRIVNQPPIFDRVSSQLYFTLLGMHLCE